MNRIYDGDSDSDGSFWDESYWEDELDGGEEDE